MAPAVVSRFATSFAVIVAPDSGSVKLAHGYADRLNCGFAVVAKRRVNATTVESSHLVGEIKGRDCVICDDLTSTAGTLCAAADLLKREGAKKVYAVVSHCLLTDAGYNKLKNSAIEEQTRHRISVMDPLDRLRQQRGNAQRMHMAAFPVFMRH